MLRKYVQEIEHLVPNIHLGEDAREWTQTSSVWGRTQHVDPEPVDLMKTVEQIRDNTLDGPHAASQSETHFLTMCLPFDSENEERAASFKSAAFLRDEHKKHSRSAYHPDEKYKVPPTEQNEIGWKIGDKYNQACAKFTPGASWNGRKGSHITKFSERLLLGANYAHSAPLAKQSLYY